MGKPTICTCENKDADQLRGNREADQRLCFRYKDSTFPLLLKSEISSFLLFSVLVQAGLCRTCSETTLLVFPQGSSNIVGLISSLFCFKIFMTIEGYRKSAHNLYNLLAKVGLNFKKVILGPDSHSTGYMPGPGTKNMLTYGSFICYKISVCKNL